MAFAKENTSTNKPRQGPESMIPQPIVVKTLEEIEKATMDVAESFQERVEELQSAFSQVKKERERKKEENNPQSQCIKSFLLLKKKLEHNLQVIQDLYIKKFCPFDQDIQCHSPNHGNRSGCRK